MDIKEARRRAIHLRGIQIQIESYKRMLEQVKDNYMAQDLRLYYERKIEQLQNEFYDLKKEADEVFGEDY